MIIWIFRKRDIPWLIWLCPKLGVWDPFFLACSPGLFIDHLASQSSDWWSFGNFIVFSCYLFPNKFDSSLWTLFIFIIFQSNLVIFLFDILGISFQNIPAYELLHSILPYSRTTTQRLYCGEWRSKYYGYWTHCASELPSSSQVSLPKKKLWWIMC